MSEAEMSEAERSVAEMSVAEMSVAEMSVAFYVVFTIHLPVYSVSGTPFLIP